ncbi:MAG TPA: hypothetical protein VG498_00140 [Terriglobales bacterium]|nr:hypothetical protein [Terriglobales bacterium]
MMRLLRPIILLLFLASTSNSFSSVALFIEEPYGAFGKMNPTGHAAVYFSDICAESPTQLRACLPGETGVVISRYYGISGYDWIAIPLIPYLYAVEQPDQVPESVDGSTIMRLQDEYRRTHLQEIIPDDANGSARKGDWEQLVGEAYIRRIYVFQIETPVSKDTDLMKQLNSQPNRSHFNLLFRNCADFSSRIINFYFPGALRRNFIADLGISTPKQMGKRLVSYSKRHPEVELSKFMIAQVPGTVPRSEAVHGVLESIVRSKKYALPLLLLHPLIGSGVAVAYVAKGRFNPARDATVLDTPEHLAFALTAQSRSKEQLKADSGSQDGLMLLENGWATAFLY